MDAPINVAQYAVARRKALAQKVASMFGAKAGGMGMSRGQGSYINPNAQQNQQFTFPYLQNHDQQAGLGVVNAASSADPFQSSLGPGQPAQTPGSLPTDQINPIMGQAAPLLPQTQQAGGGSYASGAPGGGFYGQGQTPPALQEAILRGMQQPAQQNYLPYGGPAAPRGGTGPILRF